MLMALALPGCGGDSAPSGPRLVFSVSVAEDEQRAIRELLRRFESETGAGVTLVSVTAADLPEKLTVEVRAGRPTIHLFAQDNLTLRSLVDRGLVSGLDDVPISAAVAPQMIPESFDGTRYFLPFRANVRVTYANRARLREAGVEPPRTVEELRRAARRLKEAAGGRPKVVLSLAEGDPAAVTVAEWIVSFGGDPLVMNDRGSRQAFEFLQGMWREGLLVRESLLAKYDTVVDYLQGETAWLAQNWPFTSGVLAGQGLLDRFEVYAGWRGPVRAAHVLGGDVLGIPRGVTGEQRRLAVELAAFLMSRDAQAYLAEHNAWPTIRTDVRGRRAGDRTTPDAIAAALEAGWHRPAVRYWDAVTEAMNEAVRRVLQEDEAVGPVLDDARRLIEAGRGDVGGWRGGSFAFVSPALPHASFRRRDARDRGT
jgi:trehalose transport system substrate-binding protein